MRYPLAACGSIRQAALTVECTGIGKEKNNNRGIHRFMRLANELHLLVGWVVFFYVCSFADENYCKHKRLEIRSCESLSSDIHYILRVTGLNRFLCFFTIRRVSM